MESYGFWEYLSSVAEKYETVGKVYELFRTLGKLITSPTEIKEEIDTLKRKHEDLSSREEDIKDDLEYQEISGRKRRKKEVQRWLNKVEKKRSDVRKIEEKSFVNLFISGAVQQTIQEVNDLFQNEFRTGLTIKVPPRKEPLLTPILIGRDFNVTTILGALDDPNVVGIGVYGHIGVGKTAVLAHIHNEVLKNSTFQQVYWVTVPKFPSVKKLQYDLARQVGLTLSDREDVISRAARLHSVLTRKGKSVVILDGFREFVSIDEVGVPVEKPGWKLILSAQLKRCCLMMNCDIVVNIKPLMSGEAKTLFMQKLYRRTTDLGPGVEGVLENVVIACQGLPRLIINSALKLKGEDDIREWEAVLEEARGEAVFMVI